MALHGNVRSVVEDGSVRFVFEVTNDGESTEEITYRDAGKADFVVERTGGEDESKGEECWRWSEGRMFAQVIGTERLESGESSEYEGKWTSPSAGSYVARATLRARDRDLEATCAFTIGE